MTQDSTSPAPEPLLPQRPTLQVCLAVGLLCLVVLLLYLTFRINRQTGSAAVPTVQPSPARPEIHRFSLAELSPLAAYLSENLDEGRLRIAPPAEWYLAPRDKRYLVRFVLDRMGQSPLPRITVEASDAGFASPRDATEANLPAFRAKLIESLDESIRQVAEENAVMLMLGEVPCVAYTLSRQFRGALDWPGEREVLVILRGGRLYTVTLDVYKGKLMDHNGDVFAVAAGLQFLEPASSGNQQPLPGEPSKKPDGQPGTTDAGKAESAPHAR